MTDRLSPRRTSTSARASSGARLQGALEEGDLLPGQVCGRLGHRLRGVHRPHHHAAGMGELRQRSNLKAALRQGVQEGVVRLGVAKVRLAGVGEAGGTGPGFFEARLAQAAVGAEPGGGRGRRRSDGPARVGFCHRPRLT